MSIAATVVVIPLAEVDTARLVAFADELRDQPRFFGSAAVPPPSARWRSRLCHPAAVRGVAAMAGDELVGVARISPRPATGVDLYVAVAGGWRRQGIGTRLVQDVRAMAARQGEAVVVAIAEHRKAVARALARRLGADTAIDSPVGVEFHSRLAS